MSVKNKTITKYEINKTQPIVAKFKTAIKYDLYGF